ncbi:MAG: cupin domain-containing protein [Pseudomonadota bacterium]
MSVTKGRVPHLREPTKVTDLKDWGPVPTMIEGRSETSGVLLHRNADGSSECGIWVCTPGTWTCHVERDEFCHFLEGHCVYESEEGEVITVAPQTVAFFPAGWRGTCTIRETVRKVYMIR